MERIKSWWFIISYVGSFIIPTMAMGWLPAPESMLPHLKLVSPYLGFIFVCSTIGLVLGFGSGIILLGFALIKATVKGVCRLIRNGLYRLFTGKSYTLQQELNEAKMRQNERDTERYMETIDKQTISHLESKFQEIELRRQEKKQQAKSVFRKAKEHDYR